MFKTHGQQCLCELEKTKLPTRILRIKFEDNFVLEDLEDFLEKFDIKKGICSANELLYTID